MASPADIEQADLDESIPETLPADFSEWDKGEPQLTEVPIKVASVSAADVKITGIDPIPDSASASRPSGQIVRPPDSASPVSDNSIPSAPALTPAMVYADTESLFQPLRSNRAAIAARQYDDEDDGESDNSKRKKIILIGAPIGAILLLLALIPFVYPKFASKPTVARQPAVAQPTLAPTPAPAEPTAQLTTTTVAAPPPPTPSQQAPTPHVASDMMNSQLAAQTVIPKNIKAAPEKETAPASGFSAASTDGLGTGTSGAMGNVFNGSSSPRVKVAAPSAVNISAGVAVGLLLQRTTPVYPQIAKTARVSGTVVLQATITKTGAIQNVRAISGPIMLRQSAIDAVTHWRYRPYRLNNDPVDVETTIDVVFSLGG
jgi:periplasmic protein TonB